MIIFIEHLIVSTLIMYVTQKLLTVNHFINAEPKNRKCYLITVMYYVKDSLRKVKDKTNYRKICT